MSYCRWSSDDFRCDLYCYADGRGGWWTHVANNRVIGTPPHEDVALMGQGNEGMAKWMVQHTALMKWMESAERAAIGLPHDGEVFCDSTLIEFKARLLGLRALGYRFPDYVLEAVNEEIESLSDEAAPTE